MVHIPDMKRTTLTYEVADDYIELCNEGRSAKKCVPRGYIPDLNWTAIHNDPNKTRRGSHNETTVTPAAPTEVEGPPSSHFRSKTKQQSTIIKQEQPECNPASLDPPECNPAKVEVNNIQIDTEDKNTLVQLTLTWSCQGSSDLPP